MKHLRKSTWQCGLARIHKIIMFEHIRWWDLWPFLELRQGESRYFLGFFLVCSYHMPTGGTDGRKKLWMNSKWKSQKMDEEWGSLTCLPIASFILPSLYCNCHEGNHCYQNCCGNMRSEWGTMEVTFFPLKQGPSWLPPEFAKDIEHNLGFSLQAWRFYFQCICSPISSLCLAADGSLFEGKCITHIYLVQFLLIKCCSRKRFKWMEQKKIQRWH